jgi:hypothetical protein
VVHSGEKKAISSFFQDCFFEQSPDYGPRLLEDCFQIAFSPSSLPLNHLELK